MIVRLDLDMLVEHCVQGRARRLSLYERVDGSAPKSPISSWTDTAKMQSTIGFYTH